jgi:hypothetical protein
MGQIHGKALPGGGLLTGGGLVLRPQSRTRSSMSIAPSNNVGFFG